MNSNNQLLNPMVFVKDENDPAFREHMFQRAEDARKQENRLPLSELKCRLEKFRTHTAAHA